MSFIDLLFGLLIQFSEAQLEWFHSSGVATGEWMGSTPLPDAHTVLFRPLLRFAQIRWNVFYMGGGRGGGGSPMHVYGNVLLLTSSDTPLSGWRRHCFTVQPSTNENISMNSSSYENLWPELSTASSGWSWMLILMLTLYIQPARAFLSISFPYIQIATPFRIFIYL